MSDTESVGVERRALIDAIASDLLPEVSALTRLVLRRLDNDISRAEGGILRTLTEAPRRITELAELEGLAQPTTTLLVKRLVARGWATRARDSADRRAVIISLTDDGARALAGYRQRYRAALATRLQAMSDVELGELAGATETIGRLVDTLQAEIAR